MTDAPIQLDVTAITADDYVDAFVARDRTARMARWASRPVLVGVGVVGAVLALVGRYWWVAVAMAVFAGRDRAAARAAGPSSAAGRPLIDQS